MSVLLASARVRDIKPVLVARELGVNVPTVAVFVIVVLYTRPVFSKASEKYHRLRISTEPDRPVSADLYKSV